MAKIVLIAAGTYRPSIHNIGDVGSIHDDDVELGKAYDTFTVLKVLGIRAAEVKSIFEAKIPDDIGRASISFPLSSKDRLDLESLLIPKVAKLAILNKAVVYG